MSNNTGAGKGDDVRPYNKQIFDKNFDAIKWSNEKEASPVKIKNGKVTFTYNKTR